MTSCAIATCYNTYKNSKNKDITFHQFPKHDSNLIKTWIHRCRRKDKINPKYARICSDHFMKDDYVDDMKNRLLGLPQRKKLKEFAVPRVKLLAQNVDENPSIRSDMQKRRNVLKSARERLKTLSSCEINTGPRKNIGQKELAAGREAVRCYPPNLSYLWQKELAAEREADILTDVVQETQNESQDFKPSATTSDVVNNNCVLPIIQSVVENSNVPESISSNDLGSRTTKIILKDDSSTLPAFSTVVKDTITSRKNSQAHKSVATQVDFEATKFSKKDKGITCCLYGSKLSKKIKLKSLPMDAVINGRRIIDFNYFFKQLKCMNNHSKYNCNLNDIIIISEKKIGLCTSYELKCTMCNFQKVIWSENHAKKRNLNCEFVSAMLKINCSFEVINLLLATICLPSLSYNQFIEECDKISSFKKNKGTSEKSEENEKKNLTKSGQKDITSISDKTKIFEEVDLGDLLVDEQFEIKEENSIETENQFETLIPDKLQRTPDDKLIGEQEALNIEIIKQEINSDLDDNDDEITDHIVNEIEANKDSHFENNKQSNLVNFEINELEIINKEVTFDNLSEAELPHKKAKIIANQARDGVEQQHSEFDKFNFSDMKITNNRKRVVSHCEVKSGSEIAGQQLLFDEKSRNSLCTTKVNDIADPQKVLTAPPGIKEAFTPQASTTVQQNICESGAGPMPVAAMHSSSFINYAPNSNPLIMHTGARGVPFGASTALQQFVKLSNIRNGSGAAYMPLAPGLVPHSVNSLNRPHLNINGPRWIGRANMNNNNPFFTLPGGAPKGTPDPTSSKSDDDQSNHNSKRPRFRCDDCDINFAKYESWNTHIKSYCIKRLKVPPSSTVTSHMLINNPLQQTLMNHKNQIISPFKPEIQELSSAVVIKRSMLELSMKAALEAQYIINLHKSIQDETQKAFKELDCVLKREKISIPGASLKEQQILSEAKAQALIKVESASKQVKYSSAAVEQALYKQKMAIEAALAATGQEQTALITTFNSLKELTNQSSSYSMFQSQYNYSSKNAGFNQEELMDTSLGEMIVQQQVADNITLRSDPVTKTPTKSDISMGQIDEIGGTSHAILQNASSLYIHSEKMCARTEERTFTPKIVSEISSQFKEINVTTSHSNNNPPTF